MKPTQSPYHHGNLRADIIHRAVEVIDEHGVEALTLRGIARDLDVSHAAPNRHFKNKAALLSAIAADGWLKAKEATLTAADNTDSTDAQVRLNAMGRGFLRWSLANKALFRTILHPDVVRFADTTLTQAIREFTDNLSIAVEASQREGRHPGVALAILSLYTNALPIGAAMLLISPLLNAANPDLEDYDQETLIEQVIDLVVPL